jgi:CHAD domain-containing protein
MAQAIATGEEEAVHQTRLAIRRWFAAAAALENCFDLHQGGAVRRALKKVMRTSSGVRDCDVAGKLLRKFHADPDLLERLSRRRAKRAGRLTETLRQASDCGLHTRLGRLVSIRTGAGSGPIETTARRVLAETFEDFRERGATVVRPQTAIKKLHHFRIDAKELRYMLELFSGSGTGFEKWIDPVRQVQSLLGDAHDCEAARDLIADWPGAKQVSGRLKERRDGKLRQFRRLWKKQFAHPLPFPRAE